MIEAPATPAEKARELFEQGLTIIPAHPHQKIPLIPWQKYQSKEVTVDEFEYFTSSARFANCNFAHVTGKEIVVIDADSADAEAWVRENLPYTPRTVATARGRHFYYQANPNFDISNSTDPEAKIDVRGKGGIVIAAGSVHASGAIYQETIDKGVDGDWRELPMLSAADIDKISAENKPKPLVQASEGGWHDDMIRYVGSQVQAGLTDEDILRTATGWTQPGYTHEQTFAEFKIAIKGARDKGWDQSPEVATAEEIAQITDALAPIASGHRQHRSSSQSESGFMAGTTSRKFSVSHGRCRRNRKDGSNIDRSDGYGVRTTAFGHRDAQAQGMGLESGRPFR